MEIQKFLNNNFNRLFPDREKLSQKRKIKKALIINFINLINFKNKTILLCIKDRLTNKNLIIKGFPGAYTGDELFIKLEDKELNGVKRENLKLSHLILEFDEYLIFARASLKEYVQDGVCVVLEDEAYDISDRRVRRFKAKHDLDVEVNQSGVFEKGKLIDFNSMGFRIRFSPVSYSFIKWFNYKNPFLVKFSNNGNNIFSEPCICIRRNESFNNYLELIASPINESIHRFDKKKIRNPRIILKPYPIIEFEHPVINRFIKLEVKDISSSGFSVCEKEDQSVLIPGLIIPRLFIRFSGNVKIPCMAQVVYRIKEKEGDNFRCGIAILDMDHESFSLMAEILLRASNPEIYISNRVDLDELLRFFFESGFIYPKKYQMLSENKESLKYIFRKLYKERSDISKHFTVEENGRIIAHMSIVRAYNRAWMIHHHAAISKHKMRAGLFILTKIIQYLYDLYKLPSIKLDYVFSFFRPENRFPNHLFGDFAREIQNKNICSMDLFGYIHNKLPLEFDKKNTKVNYKIDSFNLNDIKEIKRFYDNTSGGLLLKLLDIETICEDNETQLAQLYARYGLVRKREIFTIKMGEQVKAICLIDEASPFLNFSNLLNNVKIIIIDRDIEWNDILFLIYNQSISIKDILVFPLNYLTENQISYNKKYQLWIINAKYGEEYIKFLEKKIKLNYN